MAHVETTHGVPAKAYPVLGARKVREERPVRFVGEARQVQLRTRGFHRLRRTLRVPPSVRRGCRGGGGLRGGSGACPQCLTRELNLDAVIGQWGEFSAWGEGHNGSLRIGAALDRGLSLFREPRVRRGRGEGVRGPGAAGGAPSEHGQGPARVRVGPLSRQVVYASG